MPVPRLTTARLILEPLTSADAPMIQRIFPRWEIIQYLTTAVPWPYPDNGAEYYINQLALPAIARSQEWIWTLRRKENPQVIIGLIRLRLEQDNNRGFWLVPEWQAQGYMREACIKVTEFWFLQLKQPVLRAPKAKANLRSQQISINSGMRLIRRGFADYHAGRIETTLWEITREQWLATQSSPNSTSD